MDWYVAFCPGSCLRLCVGRSTAVPRVSSDSLTRCPSEQNHHGATRSSAVLGSDTHTANPPQPRPSHSRPLLRHQPSCHVIRVCLCTEVSTVTATMSHPPGPLFWAIPPSRRHSHTYNAMCLARFVSVQAGMGATCFVGVGRG